MLFINVSRGSRCYKRISHIQLFALRGELFMLIIRNLIIIASFTSLLTTPAFVYAKKYFEYGAETTQCDGSELPNPPIWTQVVQYRGHVSCEASPEGNQHMEFVTIDSQGHHYTEITNTQGIPVSNINGKTFYLAWYFNFSRINGRDIWHKTGQSGDKGLELLGNGVRWTLGRGQWGLMENTNDHYTVFGGNPTYHLNRELERSDIYVPNQSGYSAANTIQLRYETWHSAVIAIKIATDNTGSYTAYVNGEKVMEYTNIVTADGARGAPTITGIQLGGTIAQGPGGATDAPPHKRKFDAILLTDDIQDVIDGGYLKAAPKPPTIIQ